MKKYIFLAILAGLLISGTAIAGRTFYTESREESLVRRLDPNTGKNLPEWYLYTRDGSSDRCHVFITRGNFGEVTNVSTSCVSTKLK
jgi:hypothetical protein